MGWGSVGLGGRFGGSVGLGMGIIWLWLREGGRWVVVFFGGVFGGGGC